MIALSTENVSLAYGTDVILKDISFAVNDGDRVGIIGVNGAGKTSLFRIIAGVSEPDSGAVYTQKGHTVGMLEQNPDLTALPGEVTCLEYMYTAFPELLELESAITRTETLLAQAANKADHSTIVELTDRLNEQNRIFAERGGLEFRSRCRGMLMRLGFEESLINQRIRTLSGGQYTRLALARLLATEPDILMLDEPTNHLDIDALEWLEGYIASYKKTVLIISHDRYFLDRTTNKTLHIQYTRARLFNGSYSQCKDQQEAEAASLEKRYKEQQKEIARIKANIEFQRRCNREHNFVTIRSKEKQLARMELVELAPKAPRDIRVRFTAEEESAGDVMEVKDLTFDYGSKALIKNLSFLIRKDERVMFLGPNGSGKSTLMKLMNSMLIPKEGRITLGYNIKIGYYDQENRGLCDSKTVFEEMHDEYPEKNDLELRSTLALFLFGADDIEKRISTLSGGERARLTLAKLILRKVNLLIMDEPTNHLDIGSCEALESALIAFPGTIIAVSHDRYFINQVATRIIELDPTSDKGMRDYELESYDDAFSEYMRMRQIIKERNTAVNNVVKSSDAKMDYEERKRENAKRRAEEKKIEKAKQRIPELEAKIAAAKADVQNKIAPLQSRVNSINNELTKAR